MTEQIVEIKPRDPLIFRDARPFTADPGAFARSLASPMPHTVAGAVRSHLVRHRSGFGGWNAIESAHANAIQVRGPLLIRDDGQERMPFFPAPLDAVVFKEDKQTDRDPDRYRVMRLPPNSTLTGDTSRGYDMPEPGLVPLEVTDERKPYVKMAYWSLSQTLDWLHSTTSTDIPIAETVTLPQIDKETRVHVSIKADTLTHAEGALFGTEALAFPEELSLICKATSDEVYTLETAFGPFGGERRLALFQRYEDEHGWPKAPKLPADLPETTTKLRLHLVTPAIFDLGWRPKWWKGGPITGLAGATAWKVAGAACGRRIPVTGWDLAMNGPKPMVYAAPAGSVYFLETDTPVDTASLFRSLWLHAICDQPGNNANGFGLVLPGIW